MTASWALIAFTLLLGLGMGTFAFVAISEWLGKAEKPRLPGTIISLAAIAAGGIVSFFHIGHPERVANVLGNLSSRISQELILIVVTALLIALYGLALVTGFLSATGRKVLATITLVFATLLAAWGGYMYFLPARPAWHTIIWPLLYIVSAGVMGTFAMYLWTLYSKEDTGFVRGVNRAAEITLVVEAVLVVAYLVFLALSPFPHPTRSPLRLLAGDIAVYFWVGMVLIGLVIPILITAWKPKGTERLLPPAGLVLVAFICVLIGGAAMRQIMYMVGTSIEQFL